ncbi:ABC transporter permease [Granulicatella seriolae]|uniref:ABC transporter permease n=1 Tax=Granulicatella seriolae TaxID=2967226 RepID=A0ABT1WPU4_9LACT|nr:ABC transporter permease [Granulicatella seriolae]
MKFSVLLSSAIRSLKGNARRTLLTMLGIIVGISSVITIISLGRGFQKATISSLTSGQENRVSINFYFNPTNPTMDFTTFSSFTQQDILGIEEIEGVHSAEIPASTSNSSNYVDLKTKNGNTSLTSDLIKSEGRAVSFGRPIEAVDNDGYQKVAVISERLASELYDSAENALGKGIVLSGNVFNIKGIKPFSGGISFNFSENQKPESEIEIPENTYHQLFRAPEPKQNLLVYLQPNVQTKVVANKVQDYLKEHGSLKQMGTYGYFDMSQILEQIGQVLDGLTYFVSAIAGISLFIAGVGVMNMMYISVSERTKEIGIRRSMGATKRSIQLQFLLEGIMITSIGGVVGYIFGIAIATIIALFLPFNISLDISAILLSIGISVFIGIVFSVFPARSAAEKDVIEILR